MLIDYIQCAAYELEDGKTAYPPLISDVLVAAMGAVFLDHHRKPSPIPPKVRAFLSFFADRFGSPPYWERSGVP